MQNVNTTMEKRNILPCSVKSFYGSKQTFENLQQWRAQLKEKDKFDIHEEESVTLDCSIKQEKTCSVLQDKNIKDSKLLPPKRVKRKYYHRKDIFWTTDLYGKKNLQEPDKRICASPIKFGNNDHSELNNNKKSFMSVGSQTSFASSQDSCLSSPISSFRASPFVSTTEKSDSQSPILFSGSSVVIEGNNELLYVSEEQTVPKLESEDPILLGDVGSSDTGDIVNMSLNTSVMSDQSVNEYSKSLKKTPPQMTILNYFSKTNSSKKTIKLKTPPSCTQLKGRTSTCHQLKLDGSKLNADTNDSSSTGANNMFDLPVSPRQNTGLKKKNLQKHLDDKLKQNKEQTYIDIGQKDFGHVTCPTCGMIYTKSQEEDEAQHAKHHQKVVQKLKFNGWKNERLIQEYHDGRVIVIKSSDHHVHLKKLAEVKGVVDSELGFSQCQDLHPKGEQQAFLFITSKKVIGCAIAMPIQKAYPVIITPNTTTEDSACGAPTLSWCCSTEPVPVLCGISRIWVFSQNRHQAVATRLVDCIRHHFLYGCLIGKHKIAFSDPTPNGRAFAEKYTGTKEILVFR